MTAEVQQEGWLTSVVRAAVGESQNSPKKNKRRSEAEEAEKPAGLFTEINALQKNELDPADADLLERAKYKEDTMGNIATSKVFEYSTLGMICFNALAIGVDADYNALHVRPDNLYDGPAGFAIIENIFATYFTGEVIIRFCAYKKKTECLCDAWFVFDSVLVTMMVLETWVVPFIGSSGPMANLSILRLLRLLRITRISKLMRAVPDIMVIVKGMVAAARTVGCTGILMSLVLYVFSILFTDAFHDTPELGDSDDEPEWMAMFGTMGKSMFSLFIMGTVLDDVTQASNAIRASGNIWMILAFIVFILISSFMMLNMLIGILVEVVAATKEGEADKALTTNLREAIGQIFDSMDKDSNKEISRGEFLAMKKDVAVMGALADLDIMASHFNLYAELFFRPEENNPGLIPSLSYDKLVSMIFRLRPGSFVSALDFAAFSKAISCIHDRVKDRVLKIEELCEELERQCNDEITIMPRPDDPSSPSDTPKIAPAAPPSLDLAPPGLAPPGERLQVRRPSRVGELEAQLALLSGEGERVAPPPLPPPVPSPGYMAPIRLSDSDQERLSQTPGAEIFEELQRRLAMANNNKISTPYSDQGLQNVLWTPVGGGQAFMTLGVPQDDNDSGTVYV